MSFLAKQIKYATAFRLVTAAVLLGGIAIGASMSAQYYGNYVRGPLPVDASKVAQLSSPAELPRDWVTVQADDVEDAGFQHITIKKKNGQEVSREVDSAYVLLVVGPRRLIARTSDASSARVTGHLVALQDAGGIDREVYDKLRAEDPELARQLMPMVIDASYSYRTSGTVGLVMMGIALLIAAWHIFRVLRDRGMRHPVYAELAKVGDPAELIREIDAEVKQIDTLRCGGRTQLTGSWLLFRTWYHVHALPYERLLWAYKYVKKQRSSLFVVFRDHRAKLMDRDGHRFDIKLKGDDVDALLRVLEERAPWMFIGWSEELEKQMTRQRQVMVAVVDEQLKGESEDDGAAASSYPPAPARDSKPSYPET